MSDQYAAAELAARIHERLAVLSPTDVELIDDSARHAGHAGARQGGRHYRLRIVSQEFAGLDRLSRQRLVHQALGDLLHGAIHALSVQAITPERFVESTVSSAS